MNRSVLLSIAIIIGVLGIQGLTLFLFGQPAICTCGYIKIWEGVVASSGNSQHLTDWYTFSHIIHGFLFYLVLWYFFPKMPLLARLLIAVGIEAAWEITENTPMVIQHYREQPLAIGYSGDSILNSISDTCCMILGFIVAYTAPVWATVAAGL